MKVEMRKYMMGLICGALMMSAAGVHASDNLKASLFPVKLIINGESANLSGDYKMINVEGHAYVPLRLVAEKLGAVVAYDESQKTIRIDDRFHLTAIGSGIRAGNLQIHPSGNGSQITGEFYVGQRFWNAMYDSKMNVEKGRTVTIKANVAFYSEDSKKKGNAEISVPVVADGDQIQRFEGFAEADITGYSFATLEYVSLEPVYAFLPPNFHASDPSGIIAIGVRDTLLVEKRIINVLNSLEIFSWS